MLIDEFDIFNAEFPVPAENEIVFTLNISTVDICFLTCTSKGQRFYSQDRPTVPGEDPNRVQAILNKLAGKPDYQGEVAALAARISENHARQRTSLNDYGEITLIADPDRIHADTIIFNGDFKTIGHNRIKDDGTTEGIVTWAVGKDLSSLAKELDRAMSNGPRCQSGIVGQYFEARLYRALKPTDFIRAYVPQANETAKKALTKLKELRKQMLEQY